MAEEHAITPTTPAAPKRRPLLVEEGDTTIVLGVRFNMPVYTVVFFTLAAITIVEVIISELPEGVLGTIALGVLSLIKAILVVAFYMHLRHDSRLFLAALLIPLFIAIVSVLFLLAVPTTGYGY